MEKHVTLNDPNAGSFDLRAVLGALRRRKTAILTVTILGAATAALLAVLMTPLYTARATVIVNLRHSEPPSGSSVREFTSGEADAFVENQIKILSGRANLENVIGKLGLREDPGFDPNPPLLGGRSYDEVRKVVSSFWSNLASVTGWTLPGLSPAAAAPGAMPLAEETFFQEFSDGLSVFRNGQSDTISVSFTSADPEMAARIVNMVIGLHAEAQFQEVISSIQRSSRWLDNHASHMREEVAQAERMVEEYRTIHRLGEGQDGALGEQQLARLRVDLNVAQADRSARQAQLRHVNELRARKDGYKPIIELTSSPIIASLIQRDEELLREEAQLGNSYGPKHPSVLTARAERAKLEAKMEQEVRNIVRNLEGELEVASARVAAIEGIIEETRNRTVVAGTAGIQLRELERDADSKRAVYERTLARAAEVREQAQRAEPSVKIISAAAAPDEQQFPKVTMTIAIGFVLSLIAGTALAALLEHLDKGLRSSREIERALGVSSLGLVPSVRGMTRRQRPYRYLLENPDSAYAEAVKSVFMHIYLEQPRFVPRVLLVTSSLQQEGKTTLAMSLGASVAQSGHMAVVLDLDFRHPSIARELGQPVKMGLVELLRGECTFEEVVQRDAMEPNLHVIPVRAATGNATPVLASAAMRLLIADLRLRYQFVILDSPPTIGITDANIAAKLADAVVFVVRWEKTTEALAATGLDTLIRCKAPVVGAAVTQVDMRRYARYGYPDAAEYYANNSKHSVN